MTTEALPDRLTSVALHYFSGAGGEDFAIECREDYPLRGAGLGQVWRRVLQAVGPEWVTVDLGWLTGLPVSLLAIRNVTRPGAMGTPTPAQVARITAEAMTEVAVVADDVHIPIAAAGYRGHTIWVPAPGAVFAVRASVRANIEIIAFPG